MLFLMLAFCFLSEVAVAQSKSSDDDEDDGWADFVRMVLDLIYIGVMFADNCNASSSEGQCASFLIATVAITVVTILAISICKSMGININRKSAYADGIRLYSFGHSMNRIAEWCS